MGGRWEDWPPARPIRVDGGIRAKSKRGAIGEQWWSRRFISVLESYGMSGRLARGRSYARAGQVLDFELSQGKVTARVQGSRVRPYQVRIGVLPLTTAQWRRVQDRLASQALFRAKLEVGSKVTFVVTTEAGTSLDGETARAERSNHEVKLFQAWQEKFEALADNAPSWLWQLILAADQFIVKRSLPLEPDGRSIIAGYHWFGDWGRDTMIALPGLTLATGRADVAKQILLAFSRYVDGGMLPNNFPDAGGKPEYNTVDAALWYFESMRQYFEATEDAVTLEKLFPGQP